MKRRLTAVSAVLALLVTMSASPVRSAGEGYGIVTTAELKALLGSGSPVVLANALSSIEFDENHIPGSVNIPPEHMKSGEAKLPDDRGEKLIFYCKGPK
jgi:rhodanese-related sulfurtransferase